MIRMISERKRIAAEKRSTGEGLKAEILGTVERKLKEIISTANKEAVTLKGKADAEATRIYGEAYSQDPEFFAFQKTLESYRETIGGNTSLVLSSDSDLYRYLKTVDPTENNQIQALREGRSDFAPCPSCHCCYRNSYRSISPAVSSPSSPPLVPG